MKIVLFSIFGFNVYSHGVFLVLAMVIGGILLYRLALKEKLKVEGFLYFYVSSMILGIIAARVLYYLINLKYYSSFYQIAEVWNGGLVSFAGFIIGSLAFLIFLHRSKADISKWLDLAGIVFPLAIAIGRIGCVLNGEVGTRYFGAFAYYNHFPITVFEIYLGITIFIVNFSLYLYAKKYLVPYFLFFNFVTLYFFFRIFIDAYRADSRLAIGINLSQLASLVIFIVAFFVFGLYYAKRKTRT